MPRAATGTIYKSRGRWFARLTLGVYRPSFRLPTCITEDQARDRKDLLVALARRFVSAGHADRTRALLDRAAIRDGKDLDAIVQFVRQVEVGLYVPSEHAPERMRQGDQEDPERMRS